MNDEPKKQLSRLTDPDAVRQAIHEFDKLDEQAFLERYGFKEATGYWLKYEDKLYPSKAIVGVA